MKRLAILGASGHGKVLADVAWLCGWEDIYFFDDNWPNMRNNAHWDVVGDSKALLNNNHSFDGVIVAIGNNIVRMNKCKELIEHGASLVSIIHPSAVISHFARIGIGSFIGAGVVIQVDATVGRFSIINTSAVIEHDCSIGEAVHISPSASLAGGVTVGDLSWVGINATVRQLITIGKNIVVGAGSVVIKNINDDLIVAGNPAKPISKGC